MGQKVNPVGMRIGLNKNWNSRWFAEDKDYSRFLVEDIKIRELKILKSENSLKLKLVKILNSHMLKLKEKRTIKVTL